MSTRTEVLISYMYHIYMPISIMTIAIQRYVLDTI
jgi:hypothetical protein